jgi:hypothetical protein
MPGSRQSSVVRKYLTLRTENRELTTGSDRGLTAQRLTTGSVNEGPCPQQNTSGSMMV